LEADFSWDAFALDSRDKNFYRDLFLSIPVLLFGMAAVSSSFRAPHNYWAAVKHGILFLLAVTLARERLLLIGASLGFASVQSFISFDLKRDPIAFVVSVLTAAACLLLIRSLKEYKQPIR
jgi:hypothetical protein